MANFNRSIVVEAGDNTKAAAWAVYGFLSDKSVSAMYDGETYYGICDAISASIRIYGDMEPYLTELECLVNSLSCIFADLVSVQIKYSIVEYTTQN